MSSNVTLQIRVAWIKGLGLNFEFYLFIYLFIFFEKIRLIEPNAGILYWVGPSGQSATSESAEISI